MVEKDVGHVGNLWEGFFALLLRHADGKWAGVLEVSTESASRLVQQRREHAAILGRSQPEVG